MIMPLLRERDYKEDKARENLVACFCQQPVRKLFGYVKIGQGDLEIHFCSYINWYWLQICLSLKNSLLCLGALCLCIYVKCYVAFEAAILECQESYFLYFLFFLWGMGVKSFAMRAQICSEVAIQTSKKMCSGPVMILMQLRVLSKRSIFHFNPVGCRFCDILSVENMRKIIVFLMFPESPEVQEIQIDFIEIGICDSPYWEILLYQSII